MSWWEAIPAVCGVLAVVILPGLALAWSLRLRGFSAAALAPAFSVTLVSLSAITAGLLGLRWSAWMPIAATGAALAVTLPLRRRLGDDAGDPAPPGGFTRDSLIAAAAVLSGSVLVGGRLIDVFGVPDSFSQSFDNVFHLNAIRYILETGSASSLTLNEMTGGGFYPAAWHGVVSLTAQISGASIPVAVNAASLVIGALVWPLGCVYLTRQIFGRSPASTMAAGILSGSFGAFPILLIDWGVLYPTFLAVSLLPAAVGAGIGALGLADEGGRPSVRKALVLAATVPGVTLAHPSATMALATLLTPPTLAAWWASARRVSGTRSRIGPLVGVLVGALLFAAAWTFVRPEASPDWRPFQTQAQAIGEVLTNTQLGRPFTLALAVLLLSGIVVLAARREKLWLLGMFGVVAYLYVAASAFEDGDLRTFLVGIWYNDTWRVAALVPVVALPICAFSARWFFELTLGRSTSRLSGLIRRGSLRDDPGRATSIAATTGLIAALLVLTWSTQQDNIRVAAISAAPRYVMDSTSPLLTPNELSLLGRLNENVPAGALIVGNPNTGYPLAYAFGGRRPLHMHIFDPNVPGAKVIYERLNRALTDPRVCDVVEDLGVEYVLDFGHREVLGGDSGYRGLDRLVQAGVARVVDSEGGARLLEIAACD